MWKIHWGSSHNNYLDKQIKVWLVAKGKGAYTHVRTYNTMTFEAIQITTYKYMGDGDFKITVEDKPSDPYGFNRIH